MNVQSGSNKNREDRTTIWYVISRLGVGGTERTLVNLVNNMDKSEYKITVFVFTDPNPLAEELSSNIEFRNLGYERKETLVGVAQFLNNVRKEKPDILQSFLLFGNSLARFSKIVSPSTKIINGVRSVPNSSGICTLVGLKIIHILNFLSIGLVDVIVSNSQSGKEFMEDNHVPEKTMYVIPNGRDVSKYHESYSPNSQVNISNVNFDNIIVGTVGRLIKRKGHHDLIDAWKIVNDRYPEAHLLIIGSGPEKNELHSHISQVDCNDTIHLLGRQRDIPRYLHQIDIFAFPSHFEGLPGSLIEAMLADLPIVATTVNGNSELITHHESGLLVPPHSPIDMGLAICTLIENRDMRKGLATTAQKTARQEYSIDKMVEEFEKVYCDV